MPSARRVFNQRVAIAAVLAVIGVLAIATTAFGALRVVVKPGDTLSAIAARHGVSLATLASHNGIRDANRIVAGRPLYIPGGLRGGSGSASSRGGRYTVRTGDTLSAIGARFGLSVGSLMRLNGLRSPHLVIAGTTLRLGGATPGPTATWGGVGTYTVRAGDNLGSIAARFGTSVATIARTNGITNPNVLSVGRTLRVGGGSPAASSGGATAGAGYTVRPGESLGSIAARLGTSVDALARMNGISDPNIVIAGARLRVPGSYAAPSQGPLTPVTAATNGWGNQPSRSTISAIIARHAARYGVDAALVRAVAWQESGWWQGSRSSSGAIGVMQLMPATATWLGPALVGRPLNPYDASDNVEGGVAYLGHLLRSTGSQRLAIASYYQGMGSVTTRGLLPETESYVVSVASFIGRV
jgi:LysM repeat protein